AVDAGGDVFVADSANGRVVVVARDGTQATVGFKNLVFPLAVAVDAAGDVFVTDTYSSRVIELPQGGAQATLGFHGLNRPRRIAVDGPGDVFAVETDDNQVLKLPVNEATFVYPTLPTGKTLYARVLTEANGVLSPAQGITITAALGQAVFTYPVNGQTAVDATRPITWSTVPHAEGYILAIGTTVYGTDILDSPTMPPTQSSLKVPTLVSGRTLYATLLTKVNGVFSRSTSVGFTVL
ncbi:MAG: non-specific serine/threonine protein kinase, partial [Acidimicrobiaceae bacterium]|nr:non-specific serine/threonine protein kinase [Acidimicrobiaceae bacterium]